MRYRNSGMTLHTGRIYILILLLQFSSCYGDTVYISPSGSVAWDGKCGSLLPESTCTEASPCFLPNSVVRYQTELGETCDVFLSSGSYGSAILMVRPHDVESLDLIIKAEKTSGTQINIRIGDSGSNITLLGGVFCCASSITLTSNEIITLENVTMLGDSRLVARNFQTLAILNSQISGEKPSLTISPRTDVITSIEVRESILSSAMSMVCSTSAFTTRLLFQKSSFSGPTMISGNIAFSSVSFQSSIVVGLQKSVFNAPCLIQKLEANSSTFEGLIIDNSVSFCTSQSYPMDTLTLSHITTSYFSIGPIVADNVLLRDSVLNEPQGIVEITGSSPVISNNLFRYPFNVQPSIQLVGNEQPEQLLLFTNNSWIINTMASGNRSSSVNLQSFWGTVDFGAQQLVDILSIDYLNMTGSLTISKELTSLNSGCAMLTSANDDSLLFLYSIDTRRIEFHILHGSFVYYASNPTLGIQSLDMAKPTSWALRSVPWISFPPYNLPSFQTEHIIAANVSTNLDTAIQNDTQWQVTITYRSQSKELVFLLDPHIIIPEPIESPSNASLPHSIGSRLSTTSNAVVCALILIGLILFH